MIAECTECSWNLLVIGIIANSIIAAIIAFLFKFVFIPKIETKFSKNEFSVLIGIMGFLNSFDQRFKFFYESFEQHIGNIRDLRDGEWLPNPYRDATTNETGGMDLNPKPQEEYFRILKEREKFDKLDRDLFKNDEDSLRESAKIVFDYINNNEIYLDPVLRRYIQLYITWTIFYVDWLRKGWNYSGQLSNRLQHAKKIMELLKKEDVIKDKFSFQKRIKFKDLPQISEFVKRWQDYIKSELINQKII